MRNKKEEDTEVVAFRHSLNQKKAKQILNALLNYGVGITMIMFLLQNFIPPQHQIHTYAIILTIYTIGLAIWKKTRGETHGNTK